MRIIAIESATTVPALSPILRRQASSNLPVAKKSAPFETIRSHRQNVQPTYPPGIMFQLTRRWQGGKEASSLQVLFRLRQLALKAKGGIDTVGKGVPRATALQQPNGVGTDDCEGSTASLPAYHSQRSAKSLYDVMIASIVLVTRVLGYFWQKIFDLWIFGFTIPTLRSWTRVFQLISYRLLPTRTY